MYGLLKKNITQLIASCLLVGMVTAASAQNKVTKVLVAFPPGGPVDFVARTISEQLGKELGQTVVVENKPGGAGTVAMQDVARAALLMASLPNETNVFELTMLPVNQPYLGRS